MLVFTSCITNYLPKARVLVASLKEQHPEWSFCLLLGDQPPKIFDLAQEPFDRLLPLEDLGINDFRAWMFQHRLVEFCTAIKGFALNYFLELEKQEKVIYLDPDIMVLNSLEPLSTLLDDHDILLTPHQLAPQSTRQAILDNEICSLRHGVFNLGFVGCASRPQGLAFSRFWRDRLAAWCRDDKAQGLFTDQKWCDLVPAYFSSTGIVRDPGCNAASWNLTDRRITRAPDGTFLANDLPLRFYHFTGYDSGMGKIMSSIYGANMPAVAQLWDLYAQKLEKADQPQLKNIPWSGGFFSNGTPIDDEARHYYRDTPAIQALFPDPYATSADGNSGFAGHWQKHQKKERNKLYVLARKPFRLAWLTGVYLKRHGGIKALPMLLSRVAAIWREGGFKALLDKVRGFKTRMCLGLPQLTFQQLLNPDNEILRQWVNLLQDFFARGKGVLVLDHGYGGGANDYRNQRIAQWLENGQACALLTWDFFGQKLAVKFMLPGGRQLAVTAKDIDDLASQHLLHFNYILLNEFVLWSDTAHKTVSHYAAISHLLNTVCSLRKNNAAFLEIAIHDFYAVCPSYNLLENGTTYCAVPDNPDRCRACLAHSPFNVPADFDLPNWREAWQQGFACADQIRVFSMTTREILEKVFRFAQGQFFYQPHSPLENFQPIPIPSQLPLHIGVIGHIATHKGANIVRELAEKLNTDEKLTVIGALDGPQPANIVIHGNYLRGELPALLATNGINICLIPSIWPETFCYTAQEIMQLGLPLVVFPLGAQAERVAAYPKGMVAEEITAESALAAIRELYRRNEAQRTA